MLHQEAPFPTDRVVETTTAKAIIRCRNRVDGVPRQRTGEPFGVPWSKRMSTGGDFGSAQGGMSSGVPSSTPRDYTGAYNQPADMRVR